jgi:hypothetical protein
MTTQPLQPSQPVKWSDLDPFLKPIHLCGRTVSLTIARIQLEKLHPHKGVEEIKPVLYFRGHEKGLILTSTNKDFLQDTFGDSVQDCIGQDVTASPTKVRVGNKMVDTIVLGIPKAPKGPAWGGLEKHDKEKA